DPVVRILDHFSVDSNTPRPNPASRVGSRAGAGLGKHSFQGLNLFVARRRCLFGHGEDKGTGTDKVKSPSTNVTVRGGNKLESILIRGARHLVTVRGTRGPRRGPSRNELNVIQDVAILIRDAIEINAAGRVVMPGFVDAHTHLAFPPAGIDAPEPAAAVRELQDALGEVH